MRQIRGVEGSQSCLGGMASPLSALVEQSGNPAIGAYESLRLVQGSSVKIL